MATIPKRKEKPVVLQLAEQRFIHSYKGVDVVGDSDHTYAYTKLIECMLRNNDVAKYDVINIMDMEEHPPYGLERPGDHAHGCTVYTVRVNKNEPKVIEVSELYYY